MDEQVVCTSSRNFIEALTYGKLYTVLEYDSSRGYRIRGDNNRTRWYPGYCFSSSDTKVIRFVDFSEKEGDDFSKEITVNFDDGSRRWFTIAEPRHLDHVNIKGSNYYQNVAIVFAEDIDQIDVGLVVRELQDKGVLVQASLPL